LEAEVVVYRLVVQHDSAPPYVPGEGQLRPCRHHDSLIIREFFSLESSYDGCCPYKDNLFASSKNGKNF